MSLVALKENEVQERSEVAAEEWSFNPSDDLLFWQAPDGEIFTGTVSIFVVYACLPNVWIRSSGNSRLQDWHKFPNRKVPEILPLRGTCLRRHKETKSFCHHHFSSDLRQIETFPSAQRARTKLDATGF